MHRARILAVFFGLAVILPACPGPGLDGADAGGVGLDGGEPGDAGGAQDGGGGDAGGAQDGGPPVGDVLPGGPFGTAPIVGCEEAERPARRLADPQETCDAQAPGRCWFISPDGDDGQEGSFAAPFATPQAAVRRAGPGDIIYLRGGVYTDANAHDAEARQWSDPAAGTVRNLLTIGTVALPGWAGGTNYDVAAGTRDAPITVRSFPGERACAHFAGNIALGSLSTQIAWWKVEDLTVQGGCMEIGGGSRDGSTGEAVNQTHDLVIQRMEIFDHRGREHDNVGLIRINRGDWGGPSEVRIESNLLHDLSVLESDGVERPWNETRDAQHFGAVTTLSCESYVQPYGECGGNGRVVILNNHIYRVPSAFFFKNPALGPFEVRDNVVHHVGYLGQWSPSNVTFENNLVHSAGGGARVGEVGAETGDLVYERTSRNLVVRNNTFIGLDTVVELRIFASGHTIRGNVVEGLTWPIGSASWERMGYVFQAQSWVHSDTAATFETSQFATGNDFDDNCFVTPVADFIAYGRRYDDGGTTRLDHLTVDEARARLGFEATSVRVDDPASVFDDFAAGAYRIARAGPCDGRGATPPSWY